MIEDNRDALLTRLFAEQDPPTHESDFMAQVMNRLERDRRNRRSQRIGMIFASVVVAALLAPWIALLAATAIGSLAAGITATHALLDFPLAWLVVGAILGSFLPVIYLGITRRW